MRDTKLSEIVQLDWIAQAWSMSIEQLSHALCTKMATLQLKQQGLQKVIPCLLKGYCLAVEQHLIEDEINPKTLRRLEDMQNLDEQLIPMFAFLEHLNDYSDMIVRYNITQKPRLSAQQCLIDLMTHYIFEQNSQKNLIKVDSSQDFEFNYPFLFIEISLYHLLTAALQRIKETGKGDIQIWLSDESEHHIFNVKDTSQALTNDQLTNLFSHFLFEPHDKTRPGLGFCRLAILHMGGDITCNIVNDETHFKIVVPHSMK